MKTERLLYLFIIISLIAYIAIRPKRIIKSPFVPKKPDAEIANDQITALTLFIEYKKIKNTNDFSPIKFEFLQDSKKQLLNTVFKGGIAIDPWGTPYYLIEYIQLGQGKTNPYYRIISYGPNRKYDHKQNDDIMDKHGYNINEYNVPHRKL